MRNKVILGSWKDEIKKIDDSSIDLIYTDPPYGMGYKSNIPGDKRWNKAEKSESKFDEVMLGDGDDHGENNWRNFFKRCYRVLKENSYLIMHCNVPFVGRYMYAMNEVGFTYKGTLVWQKKFAIGGGLKTTAKRDWEPILYLAKGKPSLNPIWVERKGEKVLRQRISETEDWVFQLPHDEKCGHPTQKPINLARQVIQWASPANGLVLDPFCGSGTTLIAAHIEGRRAIGFEKSETYAQITENRLTFLGNDTILQSPRNDHGDQVVVI